MANRQSEKPKNAVVMTSRVWSWSLAAALGATALATGFLALPQRALSYSASQAEAQTDPDPYSFPGIEICCRPHHPGKGWGRKGKGRRHGGRGRGDDDGDDVVDVDCGAGPRAKVFTNLQDAVDEVFQH